MTHPLLLLLEHILLAVLACGATVTQNSEVHRYPISAIATILFLANQCALAVDFTYVLNNMTVMVQVVMVDE